MKSVYIIAAVRTPMGAFMGSLSSVPATQLGSIAIREALTRSKLSGTQVD
ncbi:MAG: acetyl-CoA C-acetyltransferase, partial [Flavobacteriia bacterium]|nr:acetyl-CoA C-acetyltransferase [Flavobacteriia bacterium]